MSFILRNITKGDLSLANTLNIGHNSHVVVEEVTEEIRNWERKGIIRIEQVGAILDAQIERVELPIDKVNAELIIESPIEPMNTSTVSTEGVNTTEETEVPVESEEELEAATNSPKSFNHRNDHNRNKFKK